MARYTLYDLAIRNEAGEYVVDPERFEPKRFSKEDVAHIQACPSPHPWRRPQAPSKAPVPARR